MDAQLFERIFEQLDSQGKIDKYTLMILICFLISWLIKEVITFFLQSREKKKEKIAEEELFQSQQQFTMRIEFFSKFITCRNSISESIEEISSKKGNLNIAEKEEYEKKFNELKNKYCLLMKIYNENSCFIPPDITPKIKQYIKEIKKLISEWENRFSSGVVKEINPIEIIELIDNVNKCNENMNSAVQKNIYGKKTILK